MIIAGVDPGKTGGIAVCDTENPGRIKACPMPVSGKEIDGEMLARYLSDVNLVILEKVAARPGQGVSSMFKFGMVYGIVQGVCLGRKIPFELVTPQRWKKIVLADTKKDKDAAISYCRRRFPDVSLLATERSRKPHDGMADALCLMEYGRRQIAGIVSTLATNAGRKAA